MFTGKPVSRQVVANYVATQMGIIHDTCGEVVTEETACIGLEWFVPAEQRTKFPKAACGLRIARTGPTRPQCFACLGRRGNRFDGTRQRAA